MIRNIKRSFHLDGINKWNVQYSQQHMFKQVFEYMFNFVCLILSEGTHWTKITQRQKKNTLNIYLYSKVTSEPRTEFSISILLFNWAKSNSRPKPLQNIICSYYIIHSLLTNPFWNLQKEESISALREVR